MNDEVTQSHSHAQDVIREYLGAQANNDLLRFITCGSVDDGKSTLIGRLLYEAQCLFDDQVASLQNESLKFGTQSGDLDFALLVDGLSAEREQGITIDVAYRYFKTDKRTFIVADTPGHEQYTRNMVTGASTADAAVLLVDARHGVLPQTRRHAYIVSLLGVSSVIVAINKMDLVDYSETIYLNIADEMTLIAERLNLPLPTLIPVSALRGDQIISPSENLPWYEGPTLIRALESAPIGQAQSLSSFRMSVQWVNRPHLDFRGVSGTVCAGIVQVNQEMKILPSGQSAKISEIVTFDGKLNSATTDQAVTLVFDREVDASRGDLICAADQPSEVTDHISAHLVWMHEAEGMCGRPYLMKLGSQTVNVTITAIKYTIDIESYNERPAPSLALNDIGRVHIKIDRLIPFESYKHCSSLGGFVLVDKHTYATVAAGMIQHPLRRAQNIHRYEHSITPTLRQRLKEHKGLVIWLTGLSGSGKSTIANHLERLLYAQGIHTYLLDGDNIRHGLNSDLGFTPSDRVENIRRVAEVSRLMVDAGLVVITAFISPYEADRQRARELFNDKQFIEVFVNTPLEIAEHRDPKGLYKKARNGEIPNFTGIGSPYEEPINPEIVIKTNQATPQESALKLFTYLNQVLQYPSE
jgi:bifunctional enzyme CysN/CysC